MYCSPVAITKIVTDTGQKLPVESAHCHRALSQAVAEAANYILQGDLTSGTAVSDQIGRPSASKTGTADSYVSALLRRVHAAVAGFDLGRQPCSASST